METIRLAIDTSLRKAADAFAKQRKRTRSALMRAALHDNIRRARIQEMEEQEKRGCAAQPETDEETELWEREFTWPDERDPSVSALQLKS